MTESSAPRRTVPRSSYLPGLVAAIIVITLAVIFWSDFRALPRGWQIASGVVAVVVVMRILVAGCDLDRSEVALANALCGQGHYERALGELARVIANNPTNAEAFYVKGQCLDGLGRRDEAMAAWLEALRHNPTHGKSAHDLACEYIDCGDYLKAAEYFAIARAGGASLVEPATFRQNVESTKSALIHLGREAEDRGDHREVLRYVDAIIQLDPDHAIAHAWRSQMRLALGDCQGAVDDARSCLRLNPKYEKARMLLAAAKEALNADIAASQLRPNLPRTSAGAQVAGTTTPTLPKENGDRSDASLGNRRTLWKVGDIAFDRWEIRRIITRGGMGTIYAAWDPKSRSPVALKAVQLESGADSGAGRTEFRQEAEHWLRLGQHPRILRLFSVEKLDFRHLVLVMEYVAGPPDVGPTLYDHLRTRTSLPVEEACRIAIGICQGMNFAYRRSKLVHRDLKPPNIFVTALGEVKVGDFGLAVVDGQKPTRPAGTPAYAAAEQWDSEAVARPAVDVYSLGVMLFEMICGRRPFELPERYAHAVDALKLDEWQRMHREQPPPSPRAHCRSLSSGLEAVILQCLAKKPDDRPAGLEELETALRPHALGPPGDECAFEDFGSQGNPGLTAYDRGVSLDSLGHFDEALAAYKRAVDSEPFKSRRSEAWCNMGKVLLALGRRLEGIECFSRALAIYPDDRHALLGKANALSLEGHHAEGLKVVERLLATHPDSADAHTCCGLILIRAGQLDSAESSCQKALSMKPGHYFALNALGQCAMARQDASQAVRCFEEAQRANPDLAEAYSNLCYALIACEVVDGPSEDRLGRAMDAASKAVEIEPDNPEYQANLGLVHAKLNRAEHAREQFAEAIRLNPKAGHLCVGVAHAKLERYAEAVKHFQEVLRIDPSNSEALLCLTKAQQAIRESQDASEVSPPSGKMQTLVKASESDGPATSRRAAVARPGQASAPVICRFCSSRNPSENAFCSRCGKRLPVAITLRCKHCNKTIPTSAAFCVHCGKKVERGGLS